MESQSNQINASRLGSIKTEVLIAEIFGVLSMVGWIAAAAIFAVLLSVAGSGSFGVCTLNGESVPCSQVGGIFAALGIILGVVFLVLAIPSIFIVRRTNRMRTAADKGDVARLKSLNSTGWAVVALLFAGVIPGILLLIAHGPIDELAT